jgi:hypothetical protein
MCLDVGGVDHLRVRRTPTAGQFSKQVLPQPAARPAHKAVIDRRQRAIFGRAITPAASALENMHNAADDTPIVNSLDPANILRQMWLNPSHCSSFSQNKFLRMIPIPFQKRIRIVLSGVKKLMSSDPSHRVRWCFPRGDHCGLRLCPVPTSIPSVSTPAVLPARSPPPAGILDDQAASDAPDPGTARPPATHEYPQRRVRQKSR